MSKPQRDRVYPLVLRREVILGLPLMNVGPYCRICGIEVQKDRGGPLPQGIIDDITNSGDHSDLRNLQLLCRPCNTAKNYRPKDPDNRHTMTTSEQKNEEVEHRFRGLMLAYLADHGGECKRTQMEHHGAEMCRGSTVSTERYMHKLCSTAGPMICSKGMVTWRSDKEVDAWMAREDPE